MSSEVTLPPALSTGFQARYQLLECLGSGAAGTVFRAQHLTLKREVALKMLRFQPGTSTAKRFDEEARTLALLSHPRIPKLYDYGWDSQIPYIALEFIAGGSLRAHMDERGALPPAEAIRIALALLDALGYVHAQGVLHRDIKPENVLLDDDGAPFLADFGLALSTFEERTQLTEMGHMVGTMRYMAPELFGLGTYSEPSDLYAVGVILYELLTGQPPFHGASVPAMIAEKLNHACPRVRALRPDVGQDLDDLVARAMARHEHDRPRSADELAAALQKCQRPASSARPRIAVAKPPAAPAPSSGALRPARPLSRGAAFACGAGAAALALLALRAPVPPPRASPAWTVAGSASGPAAPLVPLHERRDVPPLKTHEARLFWREVHAWLTGQRADPPHRTSGARADANVDDFTWALIGGGRVLRGAQLGLLLDWIYLRGDDPSGWLTLGRALDSEGSAAPAARALKHGLALMAGEPVIGHRWSAAACEGLVRALLLDGPFDAARWRALAERWKLPGGGLGALLAILAPRDPATCEALLFEASSGPLAAVAGRMLGLHLTDYAGDLERARALWTRLLALPERPPELLEVVFLERLGHGDVDGARAALPDDAAARALLAGVLGAPTAPMPAEKSELAARARAVYLAHWIGARAFEPIGALERTLARSADLVRDRESRVIALAALAANGRAEAAAELTRLLDHAAISILTWSELAGPWDAGDGPVSRALATYPDSAGCLYARATAESRRGHHAAAHDLLARALEHGGVDWLAPELELEVLARPYFVPPTGGAWSPPSWASARVPSSARGPRYDRRTRAFLEALRKGDLAGATTVARAQADAQPWAPVWALAQPDLPAETFIRMCRCAGSHAGQAAGRRAPTDR